MSVMMFRRKRRTSRQTPTEKRLELFCPSSCVRLVGYRWRVFDYTSTNMCVSISTLATIRAFSIVMCVCLLRSQVIYDYRAHWIRFEKRGFREPSRSHVILSGTWLTCYFINKYHHLNGAQILRRTNYVLTFGYYDWYSYVNINLCIRYDSVRLHIDVLTIVMAARTK